ncbi:MAG: hypothetical protein ACO2YP_13540, partial [Pseudomonadales bacterium]
MSDSPREAIAGWPASAGQRLTAFRAFLAARGGPGLAAQDGCVFHFFYTPLGALFGQIFPVQVTTMAARVFGLRFHHGVGAL